jgi:hypothetical protein
MPLSEIQAEVLRTIAVNRSPESYLAGATVLHRARNTPRFSQDVDLFHDLEERVFKNAEKDAATLVAAGYGFSWLQRTPFFYRAVVTAGESRLKMEWAQDSAFRFFPLQQDNFCGYRLHDADAATNKMLALAGRSEVRDFVDILYLHEQFLSLGAMAWAACGKDPGFTPDFLLDHAGRHVSYTQQDVDRLELREHLDISELKSKWIGAVEEARLLIEKLPAEDAGCLFLDRNGNPVTPAPDAAGFPALVRHRGCFRGSWPAVSDFPNVQN